MTNPNSFDARAQLSVGDTLLRDLPAGRAAVEVRRRAPAVLAEDPAREPAAQRGRRDDRRQGHRGAGHLERGRRALQGDRLHPGARRHAGLHRGSRDRRSGGDARRHDGDGRRPEQDQPARARRAGHRPLRPGGRLRHPAVLPAQRRSRVRAQRGALRLPALGPGRLSQLPGRAAGHRDRPPGQPRVPGPRGVRRRRAQPRLPRHAGRDRFAHDDDQRPRRARLGGRRASRPRRRCSASRCRCSSPRSSASG